MFIIICFILLLATFVGLMRSDHVNLGFKHGYRDTHFYTHLIGSALSLMGALALPTLHTHAPQTIETAAMVAVLML